MFAIVQDFGAVKDAQVSFEGAVRQSATEIRNILLGYQGGGGMVDVYYIGPLDFWVGIEESRNRYWNALGLGNPFDDGHSIIAEINPPKAGINRRISGAFVTDSKGRAYLAHRGGVGGGRKGIGKRAFMSWYEGKIDSVIDGDRTADMIVVSALEDPRLMEKLAAFTKIVSIFKELAVSGALNKASSSYRGS